MAIEIGGKTVYGASIGILMLDTQFPRIYGDIANANTWPFPVQYRIVPGATPELVVRRKSEGLLDAFVCAARDLVAHGADGLTTNCGFLSLFQDEIKEAVDVPVAVSSLMQVAWINGLLGTGRRAGVVTISQESLTEEHLRAANVPLNTPIVGTEGGREFSRKILNDHPEIDFDRCREDVLDAAIRLVQHHSEIGAIVLECTNMVPFAAEIRKVTGRPVYSIYTLVAWLQSGLIPRRFPARLDDPNRTGM